MRHLDQSGVGQLVQNATNRSSLALIGKERYWEWPVRYHLSPDRGNLFRHLDLAGLDILEVGAEMGGMSRYLAEQAQSLVVLEEDQPHLDVLSKRLSDLSNWSGVASSLEDYETDKRFDVVCLVGVFEDAGLFRNVQNTESVCSSLLAKASSLLEPDGVLIVTLENRYGIKYWAGAPDERTGQMFDGICGHFTEAASQTFSRTRMLALLDSIGISRIEEYYPWPDYKMPKAVIAKRLVDQRPEVAADIAADALTRDHLPSVQYFPVSMAARQAIFSGLITQISNSFLFIGSGREDSPILEQMLAKAGKANEVAWHYSLTRNVAASTSFSFEDSGSLLVSKNVYPNATGAVPHRYIQWKNLPPTGLMSGPKVGHLLKRTAYYQGQAAYEDLMADFLTQTFARFEIDSGHLSPEAYDALPQNAVQMEDSRIDYFDLEWVLTQSMKKEWLVLRTVLCEVHSAKALPLGTYATLADLFHRMCARLGLDPDLAALVEIESTVRCEIGPLDSPSDISAAFVKLLHEPLRSDMYPRDPHAESYLRQAGGDQNLGEKLQKLETEVVQLRSALQRRSVKFALSLANKLKKFKAWSIMTPLLLSESLRPYYG